MRAVLFDFFGTLATYEPNRLNLDYPRSATLLYEWGHGNACERFAEVWNAVTQRLELTTSRSLEEFSMDDVAADYDDAEQLGLTDARRAELVDTFLAECVAGVRPAPGLHEVIEGLATSRRLGIVSNTHSVDLVPRLLEQFGVAGAFDPIVLSVAHGHRKPHRSIYELTLRPLADAGIAAQDVLFVGDSYEMDYLGPIAAGMTARVIDPNHRHDVPDPDRIQTLTDLLD